MNIYRISLQNNASYAFRKYPILTEYKQIHQEILPDMTGERFEDLHRCQRCSSLLDKWEEPFRELVVKQRSYDIGITYDGVTIVSKLFRQSYETADLVGLEFHQLVNDPDFFAIRPLKVVEFNSERRKTRFINPCEKCGNFESVVGATPVFLRPGFEISPNEFVSTDLEFGSDDEKSPLILCGQAVVSALSESNLKGLDFSEIQ